MKNTIKSGDKVRVLFANWNGSGWSDIDHGVYTVYENGGRLGIDYNTSRSPYTSRGEVFVPLASFSGSTVGFKNVETGEVYHYDNIASAVILGYPTSFRKGGGEE